MFGVVVVLEGEPLSQCKVYETFNRFSFIVFLYFASSISFFRGLRVGADGDFLVVKQNMGFSAWSLHFLSMHI